MTDAALRITVSEFVAFANQTLEGAYPTVVVTGEVSEFKIAQGKWVSFKLKDDGAVVNCFLSAFALRIPLEDGMQVAVTATPRLNPKGYFNLNVRIIMPIGEGTIKKGFELLKAKLAAEGLFEPSRKRNLPRVPQSVAVVTSTESAAYADFCKIINQRWGGLSVQVAHTQVQGEPAADQMIRAIRYFNTLEQLPQVLVLIRGGGSAEDLMAFNDELLAREIAGSRIPTLVGVGHEIDHTLADMVADVRAATPTNAAEILVPDRQDLIRSVRAMVRGAAAQLLQGLEEYRQTVRRQLAGALQQTERAVGALEQHLSALRLATTQLDPRNVLRQGYAVVRGEMREGAIITIETLREQVTAEVQHVSKK